jgi:hypothetical protein
VYRMFASSCCLARVNSLWFSPAFLDAISKGKNVVDR